MSSIIIFHRYIEINITDKRHFALVYLLGITRLTFTQSMAQEPSINPSKGSDYTFLLLRTLFRCFPKVILNFSNFLLWRIKNEAKNTFILSNQAKRSIKSTWDFLWQISKKVNILYYLQGSFVLLLLDFSKFRNAGLQRTTLCGCQACLLSS